MKSFAWKAGAQLLGAIVCVSTAVAGPEEAGSGDHSITTTAESRQYSDDRGSLNSFIIEDKYELGDTTFILAPRAAELEVNGERETSLGLRGTIYRNWPSKVSTRTSIFVAEDSQAFAKTDVAQDVTVKVADKTTLTAGVRWADYLGDEEVTFLSLGGRRYFTGGSITYRLTRTESEVQDSAFAHLVGLSVDDTKGEGKTRFWLSAGNEETPGSQFDDDLARSNRSFMLERTQPVWENVLLIASTGMASHESAGDEFTGLTLGIGLSAKLN